MELTLESLGLSRDEIFARVVDRISELAMEDWNDEMDKVLQAQVMEKVNAAVETIAGRHVLPNVAAYVEALCLQETNKWGEKRGAPVTFVEYLVQRAEAYLTEPVDYAGKPKSGGEYHWKASQTRVSHLVHEHLQYSIQQAMTRALKDANSAIVGGIEEAVKIKLNQVADSLKVVAKIG